ncbi:fimbrial protein [Aeromonas salmonicida]|uniref:fimbrial protein n=1 Tax=Aeromonas salmonicida TaxID=645 RepID=UPI00223EF936|nr:fimbrial protein [Aeromonas salmonicida]
MNISILYVRKKCNACVILALIGFFISSPTVASCQRISTTTTNPSNGSYVDPAYGVTGIWAGAHDGNVGQLGLPSVISIISDAFQPPGTVLAVTSSVPMSTYGQTGGFNPEQVLYRCDAADAPYLYESFSTNDEIQMGGAMITEAGVPDATYISYIRNIGYRIRNDKTGQYYRFKWQRRKLDNLDTDQIGRVLVKAKNFTPISLELIKISYPAITDRGTVSSPALYTNQLFNYNIPAGYTTFVADLPSGVKIPGTPCTEAQTHAQCYNGWYSVWPGLISFRNQITIRRPAGCGFRSITPSVIFPTIDKSSLDNNKVANAQIILEYVCENGAVSGTTSAQMAVGFKVNSAAYAAAISEGLTTAGSGVTHLLSTGYGTNTNIATGVGIGLARADGTMMNWLSNENIMQGGNKDGWYSLNGVQISSETSTTSIYQETFRVYLTKLENKTVKPGIVNATAEVFIKVQ